MKPLIGLALILAAASGWGAETYRWVDERGIVNYGEKPPADRASRPVNTEPSGIIETGGQYSRKVDPDKGLAAGELRQQIIAVPVAAPIPAAAGIRGMDFNTYIRLQRGMTEGELLLRAGRPDHESVENFRHDIVKTFYYLPTAADPYTTAVILRGGRIFNVERIKRF